MNDKSVALIFGYIPEIDYPNEQAKSLGLDCRFAFALDTYRQDKMDIFFDKELFIELLISALNYVGFDRVAVSGKAMDEKILHSVTDIRTISPYIINDEDEPCEKIKVYKKDEIVCLCDTSFFITCGGSHPYHDTYTFSFYVKDFDREILQKNLTACCESNNTFIRDICTGNNRPQISLLNWILAMLK
jgi:hypothetical protein